MAEKITNSNCGPKMPRVALLVATSTSWGRRIVTGINQYIRKHDPWHVFIEARSESEILRLPANWQGDGIIARINNQSMAKDISSHDIPVVNVSRVCPRGYGFPHLTSDIHKTAELAFEHFRERGFRNFGYFSLIGINYVADQQRAFAAVLKKSGYHCRVYKIKASRGGIADWNASIPALAKWLNSLPKPIGILTWNAGSGRMVIHGCQQAGLHVPEEVAVLSGADDDLLCKVSNIPLSGILGANEQIGYEAAELLDRLMRGQPSMRQPKFIAPIGVTARRSTDTLAIQEKQLVSALRYIENHSSDPIQVQDLVNHIDISRRSLEKLFLEVLGRTPAEEIRRVHFERAKSLLLESDMDIPQVANSSGFGSSEYMAYVFKKRINVSPFKFRNQIRNQ
jgi:LacI family transcriptional regulator